MQAQSTIDSAAIGPEANDAEEEPRSEQGGSQYNKIRSIVTKINNLVLCKPV